MATQQSVLEILVTLKDQASAGMQKLAGTFGGTFDQAKTASFAFAGALAGVGFAAYKAAEEAQASVTIHNQLAAVLKSTGNAAGVTADAATALAQSLSKVTNYDDDAVLSTENLLLTFTKIGKDIFPQVTETALNMSSALGIDSKQAAIQLGKALQDPILGITALRREGVNFTQDQQDVIKKLVETGQTAEAQKLILQELGTEFGNSARATADPITQMKNAIGDAWKAIGADLLPVVAKLATAIADFANNTLPVWLDRIKEVTDWLGKHKEALYIVAGAIVGALVPAIYSMITAFIGLAISLAPFILGGIIIGALVAGIVWVSENWTAIISGIKLLWGEFTTFLTNIWTKIKTTAITIFSAIGDFIKGIWNGIIDTIKGAINGIIAGINSFINGINKIQIKVPTVHIPLVGDVGGFSIGLPQIPTIPLLANGGIVNRPTLAVVGEAGPEAVIPLSRGGLGGIGGGVTINIGSLYGTDQEAAENFANELALMIKRRIKIT